MGSGAGRKGRREGGARTRRRVGLLVAAAVGLIALAWLVEWRAVGGVSTPQGPGAVAVAGAPPGYSVQVVRDGEVVRDFTPEELGSLPQREIVADGKEQNGPAVLVVLEAAGVSEFERLDVVGMGLRDDGRLTLAVTEIDDDVILDFSDRGTFKLVSPEMDWRDRVRDVTELRIID